MSGVMRGIAYDTFGGVEVLQLREDLPVPPVGPDVVLVRVHAAGVNPVDIGIRSGGLAEAFPHHFPIVPGWDVAGVVERVGPAVTAFAPGDEVFGYVRRDDVGLGTCAELVAAPQRCLAHKPQSLSFAEAGALPLAGLTAYQALTEVLDVGEGDRVLVHRASGGVGFNAVQIAVALGAHVIGTASARNHGFLREAGCAEVHDYADGPLSRAAHRAGRRRAGPGRRGDARRRPGPGPRPGPDRLGGRPGGQRPGRAVRVRPARRPRPGGARPTWPTTVSCGCRWPRRSRWSARARPTSWSPPATSAARSSSRCDDPGPDGRSAMTAQPPADDVDVPRYLADLGLPGLVDVHVHFMPERVQAAVWAYFAQAETHYGAAVAGHLPGQRRRSGWPSWRSSASGRSPR